MKKDYMTRLEWAARWRLPRQEAEDVIADYRDIVGDPPRPEEELRREVGDPEQVIKLLVTPPKAYRVWQAVFIALAVCLLAAALAPTPLSPTFGVMLWYRWGQDAWEDISSILTLRPLRELLANAALLLLPYIELLTGTVLALVWFRRREGEGKRPLSKGFFLCVILMLAGIALSWWVVGQFTAQPEQFLTVWTEDTSIIGEGNGPAYHGKHSAIAITMTMYLEWGGCFLAGLVGMVGLIRARTRDRRWAAVYVLALTAAVLALAVIAMLWNYSDLGPQGPIPDVWSWSASYLRRYVLLTAMGLAGAGVALC